MKKYLLKAVVLLCSFFLLIAASSCGIGVRTRAMLGGKLRVKVEIAENVNLNSPIAVDLVVVYEEKLQERLLVTTSREWFENKEQIKRDYMEGEGLDFWSWEWVPGQQVPVQKFPLKPSAEAAFIFADYLTPGAHRYRIDPFESVSIKLNENEYKVEVLED